MKQMPRYKDLEIREAKNGQGIFAVRDFKKGEEVLEVKGVFISGDIEEETDEKIRDNAIRYDRNLYISPQGEIADFFNHSCEPNTKIVKIKGKMSIAAIRDVKKGEEVTFDYSTILAEDDIWEMSCRCGSKHCRKRIKKFNSLPKPLQEKYISLEMVPRRILYSA